MFFVDIAFILLFIIFFIISNALSNGSMLHNFVKKFPNSSFGKYIVLVNITNCNIILDIPDEAFSVNIEPIIIPRTINSIDMIIDTGITSSKFMLIFNPSIIASVNSSIFCITITGISDNIYPNM